MCLAIFSVMIMPASTITPMERASPPKAMIFEETLRMYITTKDMRIPAGRIIEMIRLLRISPINTRTTNSAITRASMRATLRV